MSMQHLVTIALVAAGILLLASTAFRRAGSPHGLQFQTDHRSKSFNGVKTIGDGRTDGNDELSSAPSPPVTWRRQRRQRRQNDVAATDPATATPTQSTGTLSPTTPNTCHGVADAGWCPTLRAQDPVGFCATPYVPTTPATRHRCRASRASCDNFSFPALLGPSLFPSIPPLPPPRPALFPVFPPSPPVCRRR